MQFLLWTIAILLSAAAAYWVYRADVRRAVPYPWLTALLRGVVVLLALLLLLAPALTITRNETEKPIILFMQDNSRSAGVALGKDSATYRKNAAALLDKLSGKYKVITWGFGGNIQTDSAFNYKQNATDISNALSRAEEFYGTQNLGAIILASDGRFNQGINPIHQQLSLHNAIYTVGLGDSSVQKDLRITQLYSNSIVSLNSQFEIRADIVAALCKGYSNGVQLLEGGNTLATSPLNIATDRFDKSISFTIKADKAGMHHYTIVAPVADGEQNSTNNRRDIFVEVTEEKRSILLASAAAHPDVSAIKEALAGMENYTLTSVSGDNLPANLDKYQVIILHGLPAQNTSVIKQLQTLRKPVWFILSNRSNEAALSQLPVSGKLEMNSAPPHDVLPVYNSGFNLFLLPANMNAVFDKMPPLSVPLGYIQMPPNASALFTQRGGNGAPLWFLAQGNTPYALTAGEGLWRWRVYEYRNFDNHNVIDECIRQTISFLSANANERPFQVSMPKHVWSDQEAVTLNAYLLNANNEQVNTADVQLTITDSTGRKQAFTFERSGNAYRLNIGVWAGGTYTYSAHCTYNGKEYNASGSFVIESVPLELMESGADYPLLYGIAQKYKGTFVPAQNIGALYDSIAHNDNIKPVIASNTDTVPLVDWKWYFFLLLAAATAEWLLRKYWLAQ